MFATIQYVNITPRNISQLRGEYAQFSTALGKNQNLFYCVVSTVEPESRIPPNDDDPEPDIDETEDFIFSVDSVTVCIREYYFNMQLSCV